MTIYSSEKVLPYAYICTHKETNQFYIGYREKNVKLNIPSHLDLPEYKTSSTTVRPDWGNYTWTIVAEFFDPSDAYTFEQQLIYDNWDNPLLLNGHCNIGKNQFRCTPEGIEKSAAANRGKPAWNKGIPRSAETKQKISDASMGKPGPKKGIPRSAETKQKISDTKAKNGKSAWNKGISTGPRPKVECPHCGTMVGNKRGHFDNCKQKLLPSCRPIKDMPSNLFGSDNTGPTWIDCH